jgi:hypothetical protein
MSDIYVPKPAELGYTFGGREPVQQLRPGDVLTVFPMFARIPQAFLRGTAAYGGVHERLRATPRPTPEAGVR